MSESIGEAHVIEGVSVAAGKPVGIELEITPSGRHSRVKINGVDISRHVYRIVVLADTKSVTRVRLGCWGVDSKPFVIRGRLLPDSVTP